MMLNESHPHFSNLPQSQPTQHAFSPYDDNGGTVLGIAGADYVVLASDTRMTSGYNINTRYAPKVFDLGDGILIGVCGFAADGASFVKKIRQRFEWYHHAHNKPISVNAAARLISTILYGKRFFPYYVNTILGGLDEHGKGALYSYDPVGSYEREQCRAAGAASSLIMPFLDNQVNLKNQVDPSTGEYKVAVPLPRENVTRLVKDSFASAVERHIQVGDSLEMHFATKDRGVFVESSPLKKD